MTIRSARGDTNIVHDFLLMHIKLCVVSFVKAADIVIFEKLLQLRVFKKKPADSQFFASWYKRLLAGRQHMAVVIFLGYTFSF